MFDHDNIAAIATPLGTGSISVIRVSGSGVIENISKIFKSVKKNFDLLKAPSHTIHYGFILDKNQNILDEVLISVFKKPHSFTGEDIVEVQGHGGILITQLLLERILSLNIRLAQPGEFSKRAFLNDKIDLIQAESIMDLIFAQNENVVKLSNLGLQKKNSQLVENLNKKIMKIIGQIEVNIDYPEYLDIEQMTNEIILPQIKELITQMEELLNLYFKNRFLKNGIKTLIIGKPNVGKSSLLNVLLQEKRAIVSDIAGTTRDYVDGFLNIKGVSLFLIDTAGVHETNDPIEKIGVENTKTLLQKADLVLLLLDKSNYLEKDDEILLELTKKYPRIIIGSKSDLPSKINFDKNLKEMVSISNHTQEGIEDLKNNILKIFQLDTIQDKDFNYLSNARHIKQINIALESLRSIILDIEKKIPIDIHTINLKEAYDALNNILGKNIPDGLLNELFSNFCLGK
ncbi:tRNA uridine-5-carboxymethylaminomethyl(34) synthesis GTPase MnmE [Candidatus Phytoplasma ziziphi]|uniref:tRNA modification GTPase MnmE n=1 Tax=Ziziphus jujuba witches'-broom phytoplasma TaxID=135727 RepID=A0A660HMG8_ZIZJU|nr:tRNA uridine-5-carboxymethylaminomethyl(34) synthesis GTPase MnmE [Candidatus Phytoplasma ziziphi]AYJ01228.1 tRNA uridine-5-carboxymethylaminomethyl(34) synthesis GTPase MnmE [Candidatus Phytoplasma ziziphi]